MANKINNFINLTPHQIDVFDINGVVHHIPASGNVCRAQEKRVQLPSIGGFAVTRVEYGEVVGLPAPQPDTIYIVSARAAQGIKGRDDVYIPGPGIRGENGSIIGCQGLAKI